MLNSAAASSTSHSTETAMKPYQHTTIFRSGCCSHVDAFYAECRGFGGIEQYMFRPIPYFLLIHRLQFGDRKC